MSLARCVNPHLQKLFLKNSSRFQNTFKSITNEESCQSIIDKLDLRSKYPNSQNLDIVDVFPGYGLLSSMINMELKPRNHVIMEYSKTHVLEWTEKIEHLKEVTSNKENFVLCQRDGWSWEAYDQMIKEDKIIDPQIKPRDKIHDELLVIGNLSPPKFGEPLIAQWIMCCAFGNWLQKYGRVRMICLVPVATAQKFLAGSGFFKRNKSSVKRELYTNAKLIAVTEPKDVIDSKGIGYDPRLIIRDQPVLIKRENTIPANAEFAVLELEPKLIDAAVVEDHEHVLQQLFISSSRVVREMLTYIAVGAEEDLPAVLPDHILDKQVKELSLEDWQTLFKSYDNWPFKPSYIDRLDILQDDTRVF
ncbi:S-adenosyl-L-methionine-dependent methyltransferase [Scheffersomyces coipomensis]|uniref:S-adenosyl-L-methionine-dependent methyltransferase n=1 Tax=Scheffersomyces coipomensis TaxID=1788519 RepID=UPI00315D8B1B